MRCTHLALFVFGFSLLGCEAPGTEPIDDPSAEDGFRFVRALAPHEVELDGKYDGSFNPRDYLAYEFDVPEAQIIYMKAAASPWTAFWDALDVDNEYQSDIVLFHVDEDADPSDQASRYDYITETDGFVLTATFRSLEYRVERPGRYMALVLGSDATDRDGLDVTMQVRGLGLVNERAPGHLSLEVITQLGAPAVGLRVAAGTAETIVNAQGRAELQNVEPGVQTIRFGNKGLGRDIDCDEVFVEGNGTTEQMRCHVLLDDYDAWLND